MRPESRIKTVAIAVAALLVGSLLAYWGYGAYKKRELSAAAAAIVSDAAARLNEALGIEARPPAGATAETALGLDAHAAEVDRRLKELKAMDAAPNLALIDAADSYVLTVREILRRQAACRHARARLAEGAQALRDHMRADRGAASWPQIAVRLKERVDHGFRDYRIAVENYERLLESLPAEQAKLAPHMERAPAVDIVLLGEAARRALADFKQAAAEIEGLRRLEAYR